MRISYHNIGFAKFEFVTKNKYCYISARNEFQDDFVLIAKIKKQSLDYIKINKILQKYLREYLLYYTLDDCFNSKKNSFEEIASFRMSRKKILKEIGKEEEFLKFFIENKNYAAAKSEIESLEILNRILNLKMRLYSKF